MRQSQRRSPVHYRYMFGALGKARTETSITFVSQAALEQGHLDDLGLQKRLVAVHDTRNISKSDMIHNRYLPAMDVDPQTYQVKADGDLLICDPLDSVPLAQRYFLF